MATTQEQVIEMLTASQKSKLCYFCQRKEEERQRRETDRSTLRRNESESKAPPTAEPSDNLTAADRLYTIQAEETLRNILDSTWNDCDVVASEPIGSQEKNQEEEEDVIRLLSGSSVCLSCAPLTNQIQSDAFRQSEDTENDLLERLKRCQSVAVSGENVQQLATEEAQRALERKKMAEMAQPLPVLSAPTKYSGLKHPLVAVARDMVLSTHSNQ